MAIAAELRKIRSDFDLRFVTYAAGAKALSERSCTFVDLDLPAQNPVIETLVRAAHVIGWLKPQLVVIHEEFPALPAAKIFGAPTIFITDWFADSKEFSMTLLDYADEILFTDDPGIFREPEHAEGKVFYAGPALRPFSYSRNDRWRARAELGIPPEETVVSVFPGSFTEKQTPIFNLTIKAFDLLDAPSKRLIWLAGVDCEQLQTLTRHRPDVTVMKTEWKIDRLMAATDLAITKATRNTMLELAAIGIPSISLFCGENRYDHMRASHITSNTALDVSNLSSSMLAGCFANSLALGRDGSTHTSPPNARNGRVVAAERLSYHIDKLLRKERDSTQDLS